MIKGKLNLLRRKQQLWVYVIGGLFLADFLFYGYLPSHRRLETLGEVEARQEQTIQMAAAREQELPALKLRLKNTEETVAYYETHVPGQRTLGVFLQQIAHIMTDNKLIDQVVVPGREIEAEALNCIPVHMNCKGTLQDIFGFFGDLKTLNRLVRVEKVTLKNDGAFGGQVTMQTEAAIFYRPQQAEAGGWMREVAKHAEQ